MNTPRPEDPAGSIGRDIARERGDVRLLKAMAARLSASIDQMVEDRPELAEEVRWAVEELLWVNARLDRHLGELRAAPEPPGPG